MDSATSFDQTSAIDELPAGLTPYEYDMCLDSNSRLVSIAFTYADVEGTEKFAMPRTGPSGGTCSTFPLTSRALPETASIYIGGDIEASARVIGFTLMPREEGGTLQSFGKVSDANSVKTIEFTADQEMLGFFGS